LTVTSDLDLCPPQIRAKYDADLAAQCLEWMHDMINDAGDPIDFNTDGECQNFAAVLHNGTVLAR
jgi:hypothetical protein